MNIFTSDSNTQFDFTNSYFVDSRRDSFDDSVFFVNEDITKENHSDTDSVQKTSPSLAKGLRKINNKKNMTKLEREVNKREKDRQRAKKNRDKKKQQFKTLQAELEQAYSVIKAKEDRIKQLELRLKQLETVEISLF